MAGEEVLSIAEYLKIITEELLPGKGVIQEEGRDSPDCIVKSFSPVKLCTFRDYLIGIREG